ASMQELYLLGVVPSRRFEAVVNSLSKTLDGPKTILEFWVVYRPKDVPPNLPRQPDSWLRLCSNIESHDETDTEWSKNTQWSMYLEGNSEPKREDKCGIRPVNRAKLTNGSVTEFVEKMGYEFSHEYIIQGLEYFFFDTTVRIYQTLIPSQQRSIKPPFHPMNEEQPWILHVYTHVADASNQVAMAKAEANLTKVKTLLSAFCDLKNVRL
nr:Chain R, Mediator of RNA polymerase II transcription subunit 18 [Schizosaccharomyces pombe 972h-]